MQHMNAQNTSSDMPSPQEINCIVTLLPQPNHLLYRSVMLYFKSGRY